MEETKYENKVYQEYVKNNLIPEYIEGADLSQIEWKVLSEEELRNLISENYIGEMDNRKIFFGNVDKTKFEDHDGVPLGMQHLNYYGLCDLNPNPFDFFYSPDSIVRTYLIGTSNNKVGKKTIVAAIDYQTESTNIYSDQQLPVTKISLAEVNTFFESPVIYQNMFDAFVDIANKEQPIVMIQMDKDINEDMYEKDSRVFEILKQTAEAKGFPSPVLITDLANDNEVRNLLCSTEKTTAKH